MYYENNRLLRPNSGRCSGIECGGNHQKRWHVTIEIRRIFRSKLQTPGSHTLMVLCRQLKILISCVDFEYGVRKYLHRTGSTRYGNLHRSGVSVSISVTYIYLETLQWRMEISHRCARGSLQALQCFFGAETILLRPLDDRAPIFFC